MASRRIQFSCWIVVIGMGATLASAALTEPQRAQIDQITGAKGAYTAAEDTYKVSFPRTDVKVAVDGWTMQPFMGITSWAAFTSAPDGQVIVMGDLNAPVSSRELQDFCARLELSAPTRDLASFPSWQPQRAIDHILLSKSISAHKAQVVDVNYSDHCPVELELELPSAIRLRPAMRPVVSIEARTLDKPN